MPTAIDRILSRLANVERRLLTLENGTAPGGGNTTQYGPNVIVNGNMESGSTNWFRSFWTGTAGTVSVETTAPLDGAKSLKISELASSSTRMTYLPTGSTASPTVGVDVFPTNPGDVWLISALMQATISTTHAKIHGFCGATPTDCYGLQSAGVTVWVNAADVPLTAGAPGLLQGTIIVPAGMQYVTFNCSPDDAAGASGSPWSWLLDSVSLQQKQV